MNTNIVTDTDEKVRDKLLEQLEESFTDLNNAMADYFEGGISDKEYSAVYSNTVFLFTKYLRTLKNVRLKMVLPDKAIIVKNYSLDESIYLGFGYFDRDTARSIMENEDNPIRRMSSLVYKHILYLRKKLADAGSPGIEITLYNLGNIGVRCPLNIYSVLNAYSDYQTFLHDDRNIATREDRLPNEFKQIFSTLYKEIVILHGEITMSRRYSLFRPEDVQSALGKYATSIKSSPEWCNLLGIKPESIIIPEEVIANGA